MDFYPSLGCAVYHLLYQHSLLLTLIASKVPLFEGTEIGFLKMLSMNVQPVYFLAKEYVVRKGDIGQEVGTKSGCYILNWITVRAPLAVGGEGRGGGREGASLMLS